MAECKDCLHEKVCKFADEKVSIATTVKETVHDCKDFKNKADFVEVVRCKDCKHQEQCSEFIMISGRDKDLVFCSYGERSDT